MVRKAIIPAAGYGTRNLPITKVIPKEMLPVGFKPAIHYIVEEAVQSGIEQVLIVTSNSKNAIMDYFDHSLELETLLRSKNKEYLLKHLELPNAEIFYTRQSYARGLGDAIRLGKEFIGNEPFGVLLPDDFVISDETPALKQLIDVYKETNSSVIGLKQVQQEHLKNYGVIQCSDKTNPIEIENIVEKPKTDPPSDMAVIGRYIFTPEIFKCLEDITEGVDGEIQLTDAIKNLLGTQSIYGKIISGDRYDIGILEEYVELMKIMSKR
ncbi:UTP--glucose-1-phosphate uridylyltransferase [Neobacillus rhizophilus]|uniref:UTP--glucose-1-phosphate uridylyltransferase n=1 Tax=Neobacillus rhizophilus TaxID=2833579 RepID=A0A942U4X0_9BACI|nr:UTP--glucose-1-phosphate uridylyltransferase [Neobacillus rhizophilus]MBS4213305.1 UTP--glucose-1-phosphate uridylyltransferase [Neobacillus rhizophilus]MBU8914582.1 UTP--glucose-1-phosphate uridylyltransferase [Bacillus sp. FJAT-29953]